MARRAWGGRTPDEVKPTNLVGGDEKHQPRYAWRQRHRSKVRVHEPVMQLLDEMLYFHGVSAKRMEAKLGLGAGRIKDMRRYRSAWKVMEVARAALWALGYDLEVRIVKVGAPDMDLVLTQQEKEQRLVTKIMATREPWDMTRLWQTLGFERLSKDADPVAQVQQKTD